MPRQTFARVQKYVPECHVLIDNVEEHIHQAEAQMFPARLQEEEVWAQSVLEDVLKTKVKLLGGGGDRLIDILWERGIVCVCVVCFHTNGDSACIMTNMLSGELGKSSNIRTTAYLTRMLAQCIIIVLCRSSMTT